MKKRQVDHVLRAAGRSRAMSGSSRSRHCQINRLQLFVEFLAGELSLERERSLSGSQDLVIHKRLYLSEAYRLLLLL